MKHCLITFRSVTPAQRGEGILRRAGMECSLQRTPKFMEEQGCGYSLRIRQKDAAQAAQILLNHQIPYRRIYLRHDNGLLEELGQ